MLSCDVDAARRERSGAVRAQQPVHCITATVSMGIVADGLLLPPVRAP